MDTLIQKIDILHPSLIDVLKYNGALFIFALIFANVGALLIITLEESDISFTEMIPMFAIITGIILIVGYSNYPKEHYTNLKLTELNEIQNLIHVKDDKLTIDKLPEYYKYTDDKYDKNESQNMIKMKVKHSK